MLRSGIPIELSPLNVSRKSALDKAWYDKMVEVDTPLTQLLRDTLGKRFEADPDRTWHMYDQIALASLLDPSIVETEELYVDVNIDHGISYGVSVGGRDLWPGRRGREEDERAVRPRLAEIHRDVRRAGNAAGGGGTDRERRAVQGKWGWPVSEA